MNKLNFLVILGLALVGCSGGNEEVKETKAADVKVDMTDQQKADIAAKFKDPGFAAKMKN